MESKIQYIHGKKGQDILPMYYQEVNRIHAGHEKKLFLGDRVNKKCRFCHRDESSTTFDNDAHLIPEFTGNKILFSYFECDECNSIFSKYETAFGNYFGVHHTFSRLKGKNKIPQYNSKKEKFSVIPEADELDMRSGIGNQSVIIDEESKKITIKTVRPSYFPREVLKCLVKIGFCAISENELLNFESTRKWLRNEIDETLYPKNPLFIVYYNIGGGLRAKAPFVILLNKKANMSVPHSTILFGYNRFKFQLFMPFDDRDKFLLTQPKVFLPIHDYLLWTREDGNGLGFYWKDFSGLEKIVNEEHTFSMGFEDGQYFR